MRLTLHLLANLSFFPHHVTRPFSGDLLQLNAPSRPFPLPRFLHKGHSSSCLAPMMLSLSRSTCWPPHPGRPSHPLRNSPRARPAARPPRSGGSRDTPPRRPEPPRQAPPTGSRRPPAPGPRLPRPTPRRPSPPEFPATRPARCAPSTRAGYLQRPLKRRPTPLPLPLSRDRTRARSRDHARSPDPEEAGRASGVGNLGQAREPLARRPSCPSYV